MILVDIYIPVIDKEVDFSLDENVPIASLVEEIGEMIAQMSQNETAENTGSLMLCSYDRQTVLSPEMSLNQCGIRNGSRLFIV